MVFMPSALNLVCRCFIMITISIRSRNISDCGRDSASTVWGSMTKQKLGTEVQLSRNAVPHNQISLNASAIASVLGAVVFVLLLADLGVQVTRYVFGHPHAKGFVPLFDLDAEENIPTFFSQCLLF